MIVKNEIDSLEQAIDSVAGLVDEIAIVDTGSTDGTWELVQTLAHRHLQIEWPINARIVHSTGSQSRYYRVYPFLFD